METSRTRTPSTAADATGHAPSRRHVPPDLRRRALTLLGVAAALFAVLLGLGFLITATGVGAAIGDADMGLLRWVVTERTAELDAATTVMSGFASTTVVLVAGLVVAVVASLLLRRWWPAVLMSVALLGELALFIGSAQIVGRSRPAVPHVDPALPPTSSFPSGHTAAAVCLYGGVAAIVLLTTRGWWRWLVVAVAVLMVLAVAVARVYRAAHHPSDVVGAVVFAVPWLLAAAYTVRPAPDR